MSQKYRGWVYTFNNYTDEDVARLKQIPCIYHVFGYETSSTGTPHLQGYIYFKNPRAFGGVKRDMGKEVHLEPQRGSHQEAADYCKKDGDYWSCGTLPVDQTVKGQMERERWQEAVRLAEEKRIDEVDANIRLRYIRNLERIEKRARMKPQDLEEKDFYGIWIWGPTGTGKSHEVSQLPREKVYKKDINKWWCGYDDQPIIWIDEINPETQAWMGRFMKIWADRYTFNAEYKGGTMLIRPEWVIVTSNYDLDECFLHTDLEPIKRRFKVIKKETRDTELGLSDILGLGPDGDVLDLDHDMDGLFPGSPGWITGNEFEE